ncbi:ferredoxin--NADP reductase [Flavobacterium agricola]|uniref:Ferredoxin--NADP reductase n=1 Tax=Flavobacterium agricola TaxID=2870839 RepID=A0ABY6LY43_9FLAO|nr:ferredoxin--NADP reductase [Flavobacterium agricola]UYW00902.1 ferredoxin--NADP reductase [Flavobacterium agricola]
MSRFNKLTVKNITRETPNAIVITFDVPESLATTYQFLAGQYLNIKHVIDNKEVKRAYSISASPNEKTLAVTVKEVAGGLFSTYANQHLTVGTNMEVGVPEGRFTIETDANNNHLYGAIAAGSGITPIISIIKTVLENEPNSQFVLLYGNKSVQETIFYNEIARLLNTYKERFSVQYIFSQEVSEGSLNGRIVRETIQNTFTANQSGNYAKFFICGPEELVYNSTSALKESGVTEDKIKFELFNSSEKGSYVPVSSDNTTITVLLDDEEVVFEMSRKDSIIKALNDKGLDAPQSCLGGVCSSCICKITKGEAVLAKNSVLTDQEIAAGFTLACQAYPTTSEIAIDFDNV